MACGRGPLFSFFRGRHCFSFFYGHDRARRPAREDDQVRYQLSASRRGYDETHRKIRARLRPIVESGRAHCWRCGEGIGAREEWDLGHDDHDRTRYRGPEHVRCNRATKARQDPAPRKARWT